MSKSIKYALMMCFAATILAVGSVSAASAATGGQDNLSGASYLMSYNHHAVAIRNVSGSPTVGRSSIGVYAVPSPSSLALFSTALMLLGIGGLVRRRGRR